MTLAGEHSDAPRAAFVSLHFTSLYGAILSECAHTHTHKRAHADLPFRDICGGPTGRKAAEEGFFLSLLVFNCGPSGGDNKGPAGPYEGHRFYTLSQPLFLILFEAPPPSQLRLGTLTAALGAKSRQK